MASTRSAPPELDPVFGVLARRLEPRALLPRRAPGLSAGFDPLRISLTCAAAALSEAARAALAGEPGLELDAAPSRAPMARLAGCVRALSRLAARPETPPEARVLLAAHERATRPAGPPRVLGIVNVTPDSFSDGGRFADEDRAVEHGLALAAAGADALDVGGESTRPGAVAVPLEVEAARVVDVVRRLAREAGVPISVDTQKAEVARRALDAGATAVNDVSAGRSDPAMIPLVAERGCDLVLMHMRGEPATMQEDPRYEDPLREVLACLREQAALCITSGVAPERILVDPGIGFGKRLEDNLALLRGLPELRSLGLPLVVGVSRKSFLRALGGPAEAADRDPDTLAAVTAAALLGADVHRVHDVAGARTALRVAAGLLPPTGPEVR